MYRLATKLLESRPHSEEVEQFGSFFLNNFHHLHVSYSHPEAFPHGAVGEGCAGNLDQASVY